MGLSFALIIMILGIIHHLGLHTRPLFTPPSHPPPLSMLIIYTTPIRSPSNLTITFRSNTMPALSSLRKCLTCSIHRNMHARGTSCFA
ncbi:hypothetical protein F5X96DRAFT_438875 [Biscogniauxia mediterranea]|nr:hypothetical protein F5X96DRAFT_438875 [Biscogniauxia mediterranea]